MNIIFRVDASAIIGSGHVMRCLTLADELGRHGAGASFICREITGDLIELINNRGYTVHTLPADINMDTDRELTARILEKQDYPDWLIIDHYQIDSSWETPQRKLVKKVMVIDDLADRKHDCDLLLDQNYNHNKQRYLDLLPGQCLRLLGPEYTLLRPQFARTRKKLREHTGEISRIFIFMGGGDDIDQTSKVLRAIQMLDLQNREIHVVIGPSNLNRDKIEELASGIPNTTCHFDVENMAELMSSSDLAIGAGGTNTWERSCVALPSIVISVADNQTDIAEQLSADGYIIYSGYYDNVTEQDIAEDLKFACRHPEIIRQLSLKTRELSDGNGAERVCNYLVKSDNSILLRLATSEDCVRVFEWRNHPDTREHCFNTAPLIYENHEGWFIKMLKSPGTALLIGENNNSPAGVLRYDFEDNKAAVSINMAPDLKNKGIGTEMLRLGNAWVRENYPNITHIIADVKAGNIPSIKAFNRAGFNESHMTYIYNCKDRD